MVQKHADPALFLQNEKLDIDNYIRGTKLLGEYLHEVSKVEA